MMCPFTEPALPLQSGSDREVKFEGISGELNAGTRLPALLPVPR